MMQVLLVILVMGADKGRAFVCYVNGAEGAVELSLIPSQARDIAGGTPITYKGGVYSRPLSIQGKEASGWNEQDLKFQPPIATELIDFIDWSVQYWNGFVKIDWLSEIVLHDYKWLIDRRDATTQSYIRICELPGNRSGGYYSFVDSTVKGGTNYWYRLGSYDGSSLRWYGEKEVFVNEYTIIPFYFRCSPTIGTGGFNFNYSVPGILPIESAKKVSLKIYNIDGSFIITLIEGKSKPWLL